MWFLPLLCNLPFFLHFCFRYSGPVPKFFYRSCSKTSTKSISNVVSCSGVDFLALTLESDRKYSNSSFSHTFYERTNSSSSLQTGYVAVFSTMTICRLCHSRLIVYKIMQKSSSLTYVKETWLPPKIQDSIRKTLRKTDDQPKSEPFKLCHSFASCHLLVVTMWRTL